MASNPASAEVRRTLLKQLVITDFKLRYQGSILGYVWSLFKPLMMFGVLFVVFSYIIPTGKDIPHFPAYLLLGIIVWTFFTEATTMGLGSIVGRGDLIRKVNISKLSIVISAILSAGVNLFLNSLILIVFMIAAGAEVNWIMIGWVPVLLLELILLCTGLAFILSALYVKFRDFAPIWEIVLQVMFYATPIIYPLQLAFNASPKIAELLSLNPLAQIMQDLREILITPVTLTTHEVLSGQISILLSVAIISLLSISGYFYFKQRSKYFVEDL